MLAAFFGKEAIVGMLVAKEGGMRDEEGRTALMFAAKAGFAECVRPLLAKEAGMQNNDGATALMIAAEHGQLGCVQCLAESEKERHSGSTAGHTALCLTAKQTSSKECAEYLMQFPE